MRAAGGLVWRRGPGGVPAVLLVHRPAYDDWSFPKGKLEPGEADPQGALREVREETGMRCRLGPYLGSLSYRDRKGRPKVVRYWAMEPEGGRFVPTREIDRIRWLSPDRAAEALSHGQDRRLLDALTRQLGGMSPRESGA